MLWYMVWLWYITALLGDSSYCCNILHTGTRYQLQILQASTSGCGWLETPEGVASIEGGGGASGCGWVGNPGGVASVEKGRRGGGGRERHWKP